MNEIDLANLRSNLSKQKRALDAGDFSAATELSEMFHRQIWEASGNHVCLEFLEAINDRTKRYRRIAFGWQSNIDQGISEHEQILDRIAARDAEGAQELLATHIEHSRIAVKSAFHKWERGSV
jgi:DNA-binding GntR family transcriptional regulator